MKDSPKIPRPAAWLTPGAKKIWKEIVPFIPTFDPILDKVITEIYCVTLDRVNEARKNLQRDDISPQERGAWMEILKNSEEMLFQLAVDLGLSPKSRLMILMSEKHARRR